MIKVKNIYKSFNQTNVLNNISADFEKAKTWKSVFDIVESKKIKLDGKSEIKFNELKFLSQIDSS